jgi:hypothetical protein
LLIACAALACAKAGGGISMAVEPSRVSMGPHGTQSFTAKVGGASPISVSWTVKEGATGGQITSAGLYTAPGDLGTFHVVATSSADATMSGEATVQVLQPASITLTPQTVTLAPGGQQVFTVTPSVPVTWSVVESSGCGTISGDGTYVAPPAAPATCHVHAVSGASPTLTADAVVTVSASPGPTPGVFIQQTTNARLGLARYSYGGVFDQSPSANPGTFIFVQNDNDPTTGFPALAFGYGTIGQTGTLGSTKYRIGVGAWKTAAYQDAVSYNLHVVGNGNTPLSSGPTWLYSMAYWRFSLTHDAQGNVAGVSAIASYPMDSSPNSGATAHSWAASNYAIWEVIDGAGNHRLLMGIQRDQNSTTSDPVDCFLGITTVAAGVNPQSNADWVGLDGVSPDPTYVGSLASIGIATASYVTDMYAAQHKTSRKVEFFVSNQNHGEPGAKSWLTLTPNGTAWTVTDSDGTGLTPAPAVGSHVLHSYSNAAGLGQSCVPGNNDDVWWAWDDGTVTRISRINSDGTVTWNPLPSLGTRLAWSSARGLQVAPDGTVGIIDVPSDSLDATVRGRLCQGGAWGPWLTIGQLKGEATYFANPLQGLPSVNGVHWMGVASVDNTQVDVAAGHTDDNTTMAAMALGSP